MATRFEQTILNKLRVDPIVHIPKLVKCTQEEYDDIYKHIKYTAIDKDQLLGQAQMVEVTLTKKNNYWLGGPRIHRDIRNCSQLHAGGIPYVLNDDKELIVFSIAMATIMSAFGYTMMNLSTSYTTTADALKKHGWIEYLSIPSGRGHTAERLHYLYFHVPREQMVNWSVTW